MIVQVRNLGTRRFDEVWEDMRAFTDRRDESTEDQVWFVEHPPVYTLGLNADPAHLINPREIPVVRTDRGGQVTYHGPGQQVVYALLNLRRNRLNVRSLVQSLETVIIHTVAQYGVDAYARRDAPGVYVDGRKLAAIGLRVRRGCSYHGVAINVNTDLEPFAGINPCGIEDLQVTRLADICAMTDLARLRTDIETALRLRFGESREPAACYGLEDES